MKLKGVICTAASAFLYGATPALAQMTYGMGNNSLSMTFFRNFFAGIALLLFMIMTKVDFKIKKSDLKNTAIVAVFGVLLCNILIYSSYEYIGIGATTTLHFMYPVFVALMARFVFGEILTKRKVICLVIASIGVCFFMDLKNISNLVGVVFAVASGIFYAFYMVGMEQKKLVLLNPYKVSFYIALVGSLALLVANIFGGFLVFELPIKAYLLIIVLAVSTSFVATVLLQVGIKEIGATSAALFCLIEPITSVVVGYFMFDEDLSITKIIGCVAIFVAIILLTFDKEKEATGNNETNVNTHARDIV
ncbi:MAG: EamA family transporter [Tissierellales bacterium]|jgi:drug/metabolite transporter (DMT)-like permease|nr:EamA family transporter [Tissierellales bacterium]